MRTNVKLKLSKYLRSVKRAGGTALYHSIYGGLCLVSDPVFKMFEFFKEPKTAAEFYRKQPSQPKHELEQFLKTFTDRGFLERVPFGQYGEIEQFQKQRIKQLASGQEVSIIQLIMTNNCNFNCKYCFVNSIYCSKERELHQSSAKNKIMAGTDAVSYIEQVIKLIKENGRKQLSVQFFGGEPLVNWPVIRHVLAVFGKGDKYQININYSIVTNGSLITDEVCKYFKKYNVPAIVSFDSPRQNDRPLKGGGTSMSKIKQGLKLLQKHGNTIVFNSALTKYSWSYFDTDLVDYALKCGCREIGVLLDLDLNFYKKHSAKSIVDKLWRVYRYGQKKGVVVTGYWHQVFQLMARFKQFDKRRFKTCSAMGAQLSIEPDGSVFACKGSSAYFGNIMNIKKLLNSKNYQDYSRRAYAKIKQCRDCDIENFCSGFCPGPIEKKYGNIFYVEKKACAVYRELATRLVKDVNKKWIPTYL